MQKWTYFAPSATCAGLDIEKNKVINEEAEEYYELHKDLCVGKCPFFDPQTADKGFIIKMMIETKWERIPTNNHGSTITHVITQIDHIDPKFKDHVIDLLTSTFPKHLPALFTTNLPLPNSQCNPQEQGGGISPNHQST